MSYPIRNIMKVIIFGATGSAGGSVLRACLKSSVVEEVRAIARRPIDLNHPKLRVFAHENYLDYTTVEEAFDNLDACLFCLGISITQVSENEYRKITHDFTLAAARLLKTRSPAAVFHYISGQGTNPTGPLKWQKIKGATESELIDLVGAVCWRPAAIDAKPSASAPRILRVAQPVFKLLAPFRSLYIEGEDLGRAMLHATLKGIRGRVIENSEIRDLADEARASDE